MTASAGSGGLGGLRFENEMNEVSASKQIVVQHEASIFDLKIRFDDSVRAFSFSYPHPYLTNQRALARLRELISIITAFSQRVVFLKL